MRGGDGSLAELVVLRAWLTLERAERRVRGTRYKVPRFIHQHVLSQPEFRSRLDGLTKSLDRPKLEVARQAARYLREIAATHSPFVIDLVAGLGRLLVRQGYRSINYDPTELARSYAKAERDSLIFLPTHKSYLDHLVLGHLLYENQRPPNHTAGGINMGFFPVGWLLRRAGVFFIRRSFKDNPVYKAALRSYIYYLVEKRFSLEWYLEGKRSRSGKLLSPRYGLLSYVTDAYRRGATEDIQLVPVSISYDQIQDVADYAAEERGGVKSRESLGKMIGFVRRLRRGWGTITVRFGEPLSIAAELGPAGGGERDPENIQLEVQKLAFEICVRTNQITPITPTSLVTLALLGSGRRAMSLPELTDALAEFVAFVETRQLPTTSSLRFDRPSQVLAVVDALVRTGAVARFEEGPEPIYLISPDTALQAAYYRNTIVHFFVTPALAELALLAAARPGVKEAITVFWDECMRLRDLMKFEFFFADKDAYRRQVEAELDRQDPLWSFRLEKGGEDVKAVLAEFRPLSSPWVLRPFVEAYSVVAQVLEQANVEELTDRKKLVGRSLSLAKHQLLQGRIQSGDAVAASLMGSALDLAANRRLLEAGSEAARRVFAAEVADVVTRIEAVAALAAARRSGLLG